MFDRSHYRARSIGVRVAEADFIQLQSLADAEGRPLGEWCREVLLERAKRRPPTLAEQTVVSEVLALRTILLNALFSLAKGKTLAADEMKELIARADAGKLKKALERFEELKEVRL